MPGKTLDYISSQSHGVLGTPEKVLSISVYYTEQPKLEGSRFIAASKSKECLALPLSSHTTQLAIQYFVRSWPDLPCLSTPE